MKIKFLGTASGEGIPALFCNCVMCKYARTYGKFDLRTPSQTLINDDLLIDLPAETLYHQNTHNIDFSKIKYLLLTNNYPSNLHPYSLIQRSADNITEDLQPLEIFGSMPSIDLIFDSLRKAGVNNGKTRWVLNEISPFNILTVGNYKVTPLKANVEFRSYPYIYDIYTNNKRILFAQNTGLFLDETVNFLKNAKSYYSLVILDCTKPCGKTDEQSFFMNIDGCRATKKMLIENGNANDSTVFVLTHFSHTSTKTHADLENKVKNDNFIIAYDGLEIRI